ncbi:calcium homeostasis endoplasmic reticulum protein-like isoform X1 [Trichoplusia ni]|uniref:Calcium homeostasis endoplasmic reticulum protein-like isoform X1 n=2 Tax=Trichoplusia ni TaxID=7111 RepID=A0A7E5WGV3_TRINI|nr:calcium homeostasis endoplasmic reticulum protein-like isoform X1 [Trichoplusia ni]XP_026739934.1 calcium homeostasis endoplasmic reticulum protein-like isoform X1 [Trichoplusia ni]
MELPQPPQDQDLRNIIDKLAQFVARNGPEFEKMTKNKQKNNPKFSFLYGGDYFNYYQYKVTTEQAILKQSAGGQPAPAPAGAYMAQNRQYVMPQQAGATPAQLGLAASMAVAPALQQWLAANSAPPGSSQHAHHDLDNITAQINMLKEQITQSENNLNAQHTVLIQQQQAKINELVSKAQVETIQMMAEDNHISLSELDSILQPIIDTCTKDSISSGKGWILQHATSHDAGKVISQHLLRKVTQPGAAFTQKLHIIYLVNDVLHHCARKNAEDLKKNLENVVVPMFCNTSIAVTEEQEAKLNKLLRLWESKSNYFETAVIEKMKSPTSSYQEYQNNLISQHSNAIAHLTQQTKSTFENYQTQHQAFVAHSMQQIQQLEMQKHAIELQNSHDQNKDTMQPNNMQNNFQNNSFNDQNFPPMGGYEPNFNQNNQYGSENGDNYTSNNSLSGNENSYDSQTFDQITSQKKKEVVEEPDLSNLPNVNFSQPPPGFIPNEPPALLAFQNGLPDLSKPPPGFPPFNEVINEELMPSVPYFELPAGLMVPLIMLEDDIYRPLDPAKIRLPPPAPPNERLLAAVDAFYASPNHERPRDNEGWEKLGLYEYYKAKNAARKLKEEAIAQGFREKSKSPSPIPKDLQKQPTPPGRRYRSKSKTPEKPSPAKSRSRSPSPRRKSTSSSSTSWRREREREGRESRRRSRSKSRSRSRSRSKERDRHRDSPRSRRVERSRSPTPPSFLGGAYPSTSTSGLDASNKGHQLLQKMGWSAGGLGASGQGIAEPISGGIVRDRQDQYKGVGVNLNDPYENFRKNKGAAFITRMKERALERSS